MAAAHLGQTFDIHGGGIDLVFPHHENEIAQSRCAFHTPVMAQVWMHNGFLQVEGEKMAKSAGNFVTVRELLDQGWPGKVIRFAMLKCHYRQPVNWTRHGLMEAALELQSFANWTSNGGYRPRTDEALPSFVAALEDDLNTPLAIAELHKLVKSMRTGIVDAQQDQRVDQLYNSLRLLGLGDLTGYDANKVAVRVTYGPDGPKIDEVKVSELIHSRNTARAAKDFKEADRIRAELEAMGIELKDSKDPKTGELVTTWEVAR
jgi:cysteinyl-tRNA synthetase